MTATSVKCVTPIMIGLEYSGEELSEGLRVGLASKGCRLACARGGVGRRCWKEVLEGGVGRRCRKRANFTKQVPYIPWGESHLVRVA